MTEHQHNHHPGHGEPPGGHGMVVLGVETVFLSHLPMFMPVHDYQVILAAELVGSDGRPRDEYVKDRMAHPDQKLYTLAPRPFVLPDIFPQGTQPGRLSLFRGDVFRNHFERPQTRPEIVARDVTVKVKNVVHGRKFDVDSSPPPHLEYILFGAGSELFLGHLISRPPDFDQLIQVRVDHELTDDELAEGHHVTFPDRANTVNERIGPAGGEISARLHAGGQDNLIRIEPLIEFYLEEGDLES
jgi:hypothetical protein